MLLPGIVRLFPTGGRPIVRVGFGLLMQLLGAAVGGKLLRALARAAPRSHLARVTQSGSSTTVPAHRSGCPVGSKPPEHDQSEGCLSQLECDLPGTVVRTFGGYTTVVS